MKKIIYYMVAVMLFAASSCQKDPEITVTASFTTDKEVYSVGDKVIIKNTSKVNGAHVAICKWEYQGHVSYDETLTGLVYAEEGEYTIKLTVTADLGAKKGYFEKTISVVDDNIRPVADFTYAPTEVKAGEEVQFSDTSTDEDGTITKWEWKFGTSVSTQQHPKYTFTEHGDIEVSLTVTDNQLGTNTVKKTVSVARGANSFELLWSKAFDETTGAYVFGSSPAVSADGQFIYAISTGYNLVCYSKAGERKWSTNLNPDGKAMALGGYSGTPANKNNPTPTPSVDADGTVFAAVGFNYELATSAGSAYVHAVNGGAAGGTIKWTTIEDPKGHMGFFTPTITDKYVMVTYRNGSVFTGSGGGQTGTNAHLRVFDKVTGSAVFGGHCNSGSRGGLMAMKDGKIIAGVGGHWGYRLFFPNGEGTWRFGPDNATGSNNHNLGYNSVPNKNGNPYSSQPAAGSGGKVYLLMRNHNDNNYFTPLAGGTMAVVYYESISNFVYGTAPADPTWTCPIQGALTAQNYGETGNGVAVAADGTVYATTGKEITSISAEPWAFNYGAAYDAYLTAINPDGTIKWEHKAEGNIQGVAAVDSNGNVYYNDCEAGKLVKVSAATGAVLTSISLGTELRTSPTIASDGIIYVTGMKDGKPTLFAIQGDATGCSNSWSQLGGNPSKTACMY